MRLPVTFLDVFAERPLAGNGLAVVHDADQLSADVMQAFTLETRLSEATFVQRADPDAVEDGADYRNRIFAPEGELPFAGHPSLGTAVAVARVRGMVKASFIQQTQAGNQPIEVGADPDGREGHWLASMLQSPAELGDPVDAAPLLEAAGLEPADGDPELPPRVGSTGMAHLLLPLRDRDALVRARPDAEAVRQVLDRTGATTLYLAAHEPGSDQVYARGLMPFRDQVEDPATGSAAGPLCAYLGAARGVRSVEITQGVEMGRPSLIHAENERNGVRVSGTVIVLIDGDVWLPED